MPIILFPVPLLELSLSAGEGDGMLPVHLSCLDQKSLAIIYSTLDLIPL